MKKENEKNNFTMSMGWSKDSFMREVQHSNEGLPQETEKPQIKIITHCKPAIMKKIKIIILKIS